MQANIHFDPAKTASFTAEKAASRLLYATAAKLRHTLRHLDFSSAFTSEQLYHDREVFVHQMTSFDGSYRHPQKRTGRLFVNLYDTNSSCYNYLQGHDAQLRKHKYYPFDADPCAYYKQLKHGRIIVAATVHDFLMKAPTNRDIEDFKNKLSLKYRAKDLFHPTTVLDYTVSREGNGPIHLSLSTVVAKYR